MSTQTQFKRILAVDPGFDRVGMAVMVLEGSTPKLLFSQCVKTNPKDEMADRLFTIGKAVQAIIKKWRPKDLAVETLFFNTNVTSAIGVAEGRGVIIYEARQAGLSCFEYGPQSIKIAVTGYGKADKLQMATMVRKLVFLPSQTAKRLDDEIDAIAVGITHLATQRAI